MNILERHLKICQEHEFPLAGLVYRPFKRKRQEKQLPYYYELLDFVNEHVFITDRQFYYHLVEQPSNSLARLDVSTTRKATNAYARVINLTVTCRLGGLIPLDSILDDTDLLGTTQYDCPIEEYLFSQVDNYRSDWFEKQKCYVECWLEKRALSRIFQQITDSYGVYLSVSGKYPSLAQVKSAIERFRKHDKPRIILYFGDLDPTGKDMPRYLREMFSELFCKNVGIEEVTVNTKDVEIYDLPTIPLKDKDKRTKWFKKTFGVDYGVEIDALSPSLLKQKITDSLGYFLDLKEIQRRMKQDKEIIEKARTKLFS